ncbi:MAG: SDR family oxidoreductase, partial [Anaeromyxobacteraceae bacterium]
MYDADHTPDDSAPTTDAPSTGPAPAAGPPSAAEIEAAARVLGAVASDRSLLAKVDAATRSALQRSAGELARPDLKARKRLQKTLLRNSQLARKEEDEALRRSSGIRRLREEPVFRTPLPPMPARGTDASGWWPVLPGSAPEATPDGCPPPGSAEATEGGASAAAGPELNAPRICYVCKQEYTRVHRFYDQLCPRCGDENEQRRVATADLRGRVALITGARVKIGYQAAILLLRAGCTVVACTRFPRDAAARYAREPDFEDWRDRLLVHGVDLRHTPSVEHLCHWLDVTLPRLDFQLHNACQTVRRPPGFYSHLVGEEHRPAAALSPDVQRLLRSDEALRAEHAGSRS